MPPPAQVHSRRLPTSTAMGVMGSPVPSKPISVVDLLTSRGARLRQVTARERSEQLESTPWSQKLKWREQEGIGLYLQAFHLPKGTLLFREGDPGLFVALITSGLIEIQKIDSDRQSHVVARTGRGKMVGEMSLIDGAFRSATAIASEDSEVLILSRDDFERMGHERPDLALKYALMIAEAIAQLLRQTTCALVDHLDA